MNTPPVRILILHSDIEPVDLWVDLLVRHGYVADTTIRHAAGVMNAVRKGIDLILLDLRPPFRKSLHLMRRIRSDPRTRRIPFLLLVSDSNSREDAALIRREAGEAEILPRSNLRREILSQIGRLLRRHGIVSRSSPDLQAGPLCISTLRHKAMMDGSPIADLTPMEFRTLLELAHASGEVLPRSRILRLTRKGDHEASDRAVDVQIVNLRRKLGAYKWVVETVWSEGYRFVEEKPPPRVLPRGDRGET